MKVNSTIKTTISLYGVQISNLVIPLIVFPWLASRLGLENFGLYNFIFAIISFLNLIVDYGVNLTATRDIAMNKNNLHKNSVVFWRTLFVQGILCILSLGILVLLGVVFQKVSSHFFLYLLAFMDCIGSLINTTYYFQGIGKLAIPSTANLIARIISLPFLFIFVTSPADIGLAIIIANAPIWVASIYCLYIIIKKGLVKKVSINKKIILNGFRSGFYPFLTSGLATIYTGSFQIIIGLVINNSAVAIFAVADKLIKALNALITPVSLAVYHQISLNINSNIVLLKKLLKSAILFNVVLGITFAITIYLGLFQFVINILFSNRYSESLFIIKILAFCPLFWGMNQIVYMVILAMKKEAQMAKIYSYILLFQIPLLYFAAEFFRLKGAAAVMVITDFSILALACIFCLNEMKRRAYPILSV